jgi:FMN-dependent oxidoreductase (nitrilotriacetate monooxygenase family)
MFHMGWFLSYDVHSWRDTWAGRGATEWVSPDFYIDMSRALERAGFDYLMFEDGSFVPDSYGSSPDYFLRNASAVPKHDPLTLLATLARATTNIGLIATVTTSFYPPYIAARLMATLDHLSGGRVGANLVTSHNVRTAQNYGMDAQLEHDERYLMAQEWVTAVTALWDSWRPGAVVADPVSGIFSDHEKVTPIDYTGEYFSVRGPMNTTPGPQGRPVLCQAGGSPAGRDFGARYADTVLAQVGSVEAMKEFRDDISMRAIEAGRRPEDVKVMFISSFLLADTDARAQELYRDQLAATEANIEANLVSMSYASGQDFSKYDLDAPIPTVETNAARASTAHHLQPRDGAVTLRDIASKPPLIPQFTGCPETVAVQMGEAMEYAGGDGFLVAGPVNRRYISEIADGLGPALRRRGLTRDGYSHSTFRENLMAF